MRNTKASRRRGCDYERQVAKELRELGFPGVVTSRSESKAMDDKKVDIIDTEHKLPCNIQTKRTTATPNYFDIQKDSDHSLPFVLFWNKQKPTESTFRSVGEVVFCDKDFFYELLKNYING